MARSAQGRKKEPVPRKMNLRSATSGRCLRCVCCVVRSRGAHDKYWLSRRPVRIGRGMRRGRQLGSETSTAITRNHQDFGRESKTTRFGSRANLRTPRPTTELRVDIASAHTCRRTANRRSILLHYETIPEIPSVIILIRSGRSSASPVPVAAIELSFKSLPAPESASVMWPFESRYRSGETPSANA